MDQVDETRRRPRMHKEEGEVGGGQGCRALTAGILGDSVEWSGSF